MIRPWKQLLFVQLFYLQLYYFDILLIINYNNRKKLLKQRNKQIYNDLNSRRQKWDNNLNNLELMKLYQEDGMKVIKLLIISRQLTEIGNISIQQQILQIQELQLQLWQYDVEKIFQKDHGVPKQYLQKLKKMKMGKSNRLCSICCNQFQKDELIIQLPCKHIYHKSCVEIWLQSSTKCPNCRSDVLEHLREQEK
ncbi:unnamed protein product [Paramecium sonneborni]|uniref:RING-type domain-containing protein n=1 Tax=Paramecium sonneborni TaxID=65129 RepID=A0A8S1M6L3_9CILI|nr:unnamed protein product [Paramecium sonneborni]